MKHLLIVGAGGFGREMFGAARESVGYGTEFDIKGFLDARPDALDGFVGYPPVVGAPDIYVPESDDVFVTALGGIAARRRCAAGSLGANAKFRVAKGAALWGQIPGEVLTEYLPDGVAVTQSGKKWTLPKAGKVAYLRGTTEVDETKLGENPSALKLTYKAADGSFKGSFKAYADDGGRLKATTVNVTGVMVNGVGYGTATVKGKGSVAVRVE